MVVSRRCRHLHAHWRDVSTRAPHDSFIGRELTGFCCWFSKFQQFAGVELKLERGVLTVFAADASETDHADCKCLSLRCPSSPSARPCRACNASPLSARNAEMSSSVRPMTRTCIG